MQKEKVNSREAILKHITKIDEYFNNKEHVPESEGHEALLMIGMYAKEKAKYSFRVGLMSSFRTLFFTHFIFPYLNLFQFLYL